MLTYKQSGVDIDEGNRAVDLIKGKIKSTYDNNVIGDLGNFSGLYSLKEFVGMEEPVLLSSTDGVGTKLRLAQMMDKHDTVGIDLVAMCVNDLICQGAKPLFFLDYIATGKLVAENIDQIVAGIVDGCKMAGCALILFCLKSILALRTLFSNVFGGNEIKKGDVHYTLLHSNKALLITLYEFLSAVLFLYGVCIHEKGKIILKYLPYKYMHTNILLFTHACSL